MGVLSTLGSSPSKSRNPLQHSPDAQGDLGGQECNPVGHLSICESGRQSLPALVLLFIFFWRCGGSSGRGSAFCLAARLGSWRFASVVVSERDELGMGRSVEEADRDTKRSQLAKAGGSKPISDLRGTEGAFACDQLCEASVGTLYLCSLPYIRLLGGLGADLNISFWRPTRRQRNPLSRWPRLNPTASQACFQWAVAIICNLCSVPHHTAEQVLIRIIICYFCQENSVAWESLHAS